MTSISVYKAAKITGCHPKRLRKLMHACGHLDAHAMAMTDGQAMLDISRDVGFLDRVSTAMSLLEAREYLNVPRPHDRLLLESGHLVPWIRGGTEILKDHAFAKADLDAWLTRLLAGATPKSPEEEDLRTIPDAARQANCSAMDIVRLILDGNLERRRTDPEAKGYLSLLVDPSEIGPFVHLADHGGVTLKEVERRIGLSSHALKCIVRDGHLPSRRVINPVNRYPQNVVDEPEILTFVDRYATMGRLSIETGIHARALKAKLVQAGVLPAFPDIEGSPYERKAVRAAGILPPEG